MRSFGPLYEHQGSEGVCGTARAVGRDTDLALLQEPVSESSSRHPPPQQNRAEQSVGNAMELAPQMLTEFCSASFHSGLHRQW